jgi:predicted phosphodiesterase
MRVAALFDIHGNLPALEAVLEEVRDAGVDRVVVGGDVVLGPMQRETLNCLLGLDLPVQFLYGNCEVAVLAEMAGRDSGVPPQVRDSVRWSAQYLQADYETLLSSWPMTVRVRMPELGDVLFCHATPRHENEIFTRLTPEDRLLPIFEGLGVSLVVCGHTHMQFDRRIGSTRVVNAGSVGMPFGEPGADWLLLGPDVQLRHTSYDLAGASQRVRQSGYPQAEEFAAKYILQPPAEAQMLELFTRASVR